MNKTIDQKHGITLLDLIEETSRVHVWSAVQTTLDRSVFLVILKEEPASDPVAVDYFLRIARQFAKIKCESLAAIFDIISEENLHFVIMEHVDGSSLDEIIRESGTLEYNQALRVATSVTAALKQLWHNSSIVHRNIKGSTIRFDSRGIAKLMDFSLAVIDNSDFDAEVIDQGHLTGTPPFISPEQISGEIKLSTQSDMYALGALLYYISTGTAPFEKLEVQDILSAHIYKELPPPHKIRSSLPIDFSLVIHKLMMKEPEHRYRNWAELHHDLHCLLHGKKPVCSNVDIMHLSTIVPDFNKPLEKNDGEPSFKIKTKKRNKYLAEKQDMHVSHHHQADEKSRRFKQQLIYWAILGLWFVGLFWFRAVIQVDPEQKRKLLDKGKNIGSVLEKLTTKKKRRPAKSQSQPPQATLPQVERVPRSESTASTAASPSQPPPSVLVDQLAQKLKNGDLAAVIAALSDQGVVFAGKDQLLATLQSIPETDTLVAKHLRNNIGRPLVMNFKGKPRKVIPRKVYDGTVKLEANGRAVNVSIASLTAEQKSLWIDPPQTMPEHIALCLLLLQTPNAAQAADYAGKCGALKPIIQRAATL